jgi:murein DD-endopeptidase MepM/ murein hydrolase activator NlpD
MAPRGTPVVSVEDGRVLRLTRTASGGIALYATNLDEQFVYYYAHLDAYHATMYTGRPLMRGDTIGFVGTTGNAPKDAPHLHFQMMRMPANGKFWNGEPINPYPFLRTSSATAVER